MAMPSITGIELGPDSCVLVRARPRAGGAEVSSVELIDRTTWAAHGRNIAVELRAVRRSKRFPRHARVVAWTLTQSTSQNDPAVRSLLKPIAAAGFRVQRVLTPPEALAEIARTRPRDPGATAAWLALNTHGAAIAIVRDGLLLFGKSFEWKYSVDTVGHRAEMLRRYSLVSHLGPEVRRAIALVRTSYGAIVETAITCGDLPELRSLTMPLIEELDLEVETLDSTEGLYAVGRARTDRFAEWAPLLQLASAAAIARVPISRRTPAVRPILRVAAAALIVGTAGLLAYRYWPQAPARPVADRIGIESLAPMQSGISHAAPPAGREAISTSAPAAREKTIVSPTTGVSMPEPPVAMTPRRAAARPETQPAPPPEPRAMDTTAQMSIASAAPRRARPSADRLPLESGPGRADTVRRKPVPLKDALPSVDSILVSQERRLAIVEGRILGVGDRIGPRVVADIERDAVVLQEASGHQVRIRLRPEPERWR